jgi:hypothetical protein
MQQLPAFQAFVAVAQHRDEQRATFTEPELIGNYRTFGDSDLPASAGRRDLGSTPTPQVSCRSTRSAVTVSVFVYGAMGACIGLFMARSIGSPPERRNRHTSTAASARNAMFSTVV